MAVIAALLRIYSYLYHLILALFLLAIAMVAVLSAGTEGLKLGVLPWKGTTLTYWLLGIGLIGLISIFLAWANRARWLFFLYTVAVFGLMIRGYFLSGYTFSGRDEFNFAIYLTVGALIAIAGGWSQMRRRPKSRR